jgi:hypothetical protein
MKRFLISLLFTWLALVQPARAQWIGIFFDPTGTTCSKDIHRGDQGSFWVLAVLAGPAEAGITGAEFGISGIPSGFYSSATVLGDAILAGNPNTPVGSDIAFKTCQAGSNRIVQLCRVDYAVSVDLPTTVLSVVARSPGINPTFNCPVLSQCDSGPLCQPEPAFPKLSLVCARGLQAVINGSCTVDTPGLAIRSDLLSAWPNPASGSTTLAFEILRSGDVRLQIYDLAGRRVRDLTSGSVDAGRHQTAWDGRDAQGHRLSSGVYFVRLTTPSTSAQRRITLLR